MGVRRIWLQ